VSTEKKGSQANRSTGNINISKNARLDSLMDEALSALEGLSGEKATDPSTQKGEEDPDTGGLAELPEEVIDIGDDGRPVPEHAPAPEAAPETTPKAPPPAHGAAPIPPEVAAKMLEYKDKAEGYYNQLVRMAADFDNFRKRAVQDRQKYAQMANESFFTELLPIMDDFERALGYINNKYPDDPAMQGMAMIQGRLNEVLTRFGLRRFVSVGKKFDPNYHQAVTVRESDQMEPETVMEEYQPGYLFHERLLRPAMVIVSRLPKVRDEGAGQNAEG